MERATPVQMRKSLELVELFKKTGLRFVPMPVFDENDFGNCIAEMTQKLNEIERRASATETPPKTPQSLAATQEAVIAWLANGETGLSSETMAFWLAFGVRKNEIDHPYDPDDMDRCLKLLHHAPGLRERLPKMAEMGNVWAALIARWDEIEATQLDEIGFDWTKARSAPKTYALMREIINGARNKAA